MLKFKVNGTQHAIDVDPSTPLLWVLSENLGLTGTKFGCDMAQCGRLHGASRRRSDPFVRHASLAQPGKKWSLSKGFPTILAIRCSDTGITCASSCANYAADRLAVYFGTMVHTIRLP